MKTPKDFINEYVIGCNKERLKQHWHFQQSIIDAMEKYAEYKNKK